MGLGKITWSSGLHAVIAVIVSSLTVLCSLYIHPVLGAVFVGPALFYGREMTAYQKWREKQGDGKDNILQLTDLNPTRWNKGGRGDGTWDFLLPLIVCVAGGVALMVIGV